jgi:hypothetical protein
MAVSKHIADGVDDFSQLMRQRAASVTILSLEPALQQKRLQNRPFHIAQVCCILFTSIHLSTGLPYLSIFTLKGLIVVVLFNLTGCSQKIMGTNCT